MWVCGSSSSQRTKVASGVMWSERLGDLCIEDPNLCGCLALDRTIVLADSVLSSQSGRRLSTASQVSLSPLLPLENL